MHWAGPVGMQMGMETASFSLSVVMVGWLGTLALASHQIMLTISQFTFMMYYGMGAAVAVRVSNFKGQETGRMCAARRMPAFTSSCVWRWCCWVSSLRFAVR